MKSSGSQMGYPASKNEYTVFWMVYPVSLMGDNLFILQDRKSNVLFEKMSSEVLKICPSIFIRFLSISGLKFNILTTRWVLEYVLVLKFLIRIFWKSNLTVTTWCYSSTILPFVNRWILQNKNPLLQEPGSVTSRPFRKSW